MSEQIKFINDFQIETPSGFSNFAGVSKKSVNVMFTLKFSDGTVVKCSENHKFKFPNGDFLEACHILEGDELLDTNGNSKLVVSITYETGEFTVYGINGVELNEEYYSDSVISHNCAFIKGVDEIWASAQSTLSTGGKAIVLSTPNGTGNFFHKTWQKAESGDGWNSIKLHWTVHPERNQKWRDEQTKLLGEKYAAQECDCSFVSSGHTVVDGELIQWYEQTYVEEPAEKRGIGGDYWIWRQPDYTKSYIVVADVARGDGADYSAFHVIDIETVEQVAEYKGKIGTKEYGNMLVSVATEWNDALLVIENANIGWAVIQEVIDRGYKNLYYSYREFGYVDDVVHLQKGVDLKDKSQMVPGFSMTSKTRPLVISKIETYMREQVPIVHSKRLIDELYVFIWNGSRAEAQVGYNDDLIMSFGTALWVRDTAIKLRQQGLDLTRRTLTHAYKTNTIIHRGNNIPNNPWQMKNVKGGDEDIRWLL
jgi:hypothetical protein